MDYDSSLLIYAAIALLIVWGGREYLRRKKGINIDNIDVSPYFKKFYAVVRHYYNSARYSFKKNPIIDKQTGNMSLIMLKAGDNKATVMATLRQITGVDYEIAKDIVDSVPAKFMINVSSKEAEMTKKALEFVGAKIEME